MKIAITGSSGLIGWALVTALRGEGHSVLRLVRRSPSGPDEIQWDPRRGELDSELLEGIDAVVNLAGAGIGDRRWTRAYRQEIYASRVNGTQTLVRALAVLDAKPRVLLSGSAIGFYGNTEDRSVEESSEAGTGFLADLARAWESAAAEAAEVGIRVVRLRSGHVLSGSGGLLKRMLPIFRLGVGTPLGSGRQYMSWISLPDWLGAFGLLLESDLEGPVNLTAPAPVTNAEFTRALAAAVHRPSLPIGVPAFALRLALDGFADDVLGGQRVLPHRLTEAGYTFRHPTLDEALAAVINRPTPS